MREKADFAITTRVLDIPASQVDVASDNGSQLIGLTEANTVAVSSCCREPNLLLHHKRVEGDRTRGRFLSPALDLFHRIELRDRGGYCSRRSLAHGSAAFGQWTKGLASQWPGGRLAAVPTIRAQCKCALPCMRGRASPPSAFRCKRRKVCYLSSICSKRFSGRLEPAGSAESETSPFRVIVGSLTLLPRESKPRRDCEK